MYVARKEDGSIYGAWTVRQWEGQESLPANDTDLVAFINRAPPTMTTEQKLASLGITSQDLRQFLGLE